MQKTLAYAPSVMAKVMLSDGTVVDLSDDIVSGNVRRLVNSHSEATLRLANKNGKYDRLIKPMDRIVIEASKDRSYRLFSGYVDSAPYYATWDGDVQITASCTIKRLQNFYWDPWLLTSASLLAQVGNQQIGPDSGTSRSARDILTKVAQWPESQIHVGELPSSFIEYAQSVYDALQPVLEEEGKAGQAFFDALIGSASSYGFGSVDGVPTSIPQEYAAKIAELSALHNVPAAYVCAVAKQESSWNPKATNANTNGTGDYGLMQINTIHRSSYPDYFPPSLGWQDGNRSLEIGVKMLGGLLAEVKQKIPDASFDEQLHRTYATYNGGRGNWSKATPQKNASSVMRIYNEYKQELSSVAASVVSAATAPLNDNLSLGYQKPEPNVSTSGVPSYGQANNETLYQIYGRTEADVTAQLVQISFVDKSVRVHRLAANAFLAVSEAIKRTPEYINNTYRINSIGTFKWRMVIPSGRSRSWHSWGIAMDINPSTNPQRRPLTRDMPDSWVKAFEENGFGWGGRWKSLPDPMHFQYQGGNHGVYQGGAVGASAPGQGKSTLETVFWALNEFPQTQVESIQYSGKRALISTRPVWGDILSLFQASQRSVCSAPDGSLIAWYPDRFGLHSQTPYMTIRDTELIDLQVVTSDASYTSHVFAAGTAAPTLRLDISDWLMSTGIVSIEDLQDTLENFVVIPYGKKDDYSAESLYRRYGARPYKVPENKLNISSSHNNGILPFMFALYTWMEKWAQQFTANAQVTFMPELFPGTRVFFEGSGLEMYVESVSHNFDYQSGFTTNADFSCPVSRGESMPGMVRSPGNRNEGGDLVIQEPVPSGTSTEED